LARASDSGCEWLAPKDKSRPLSHSLEITYTHCHPIRKVVVSAVFGLVDWLAIPNGTRAKQIGLWHGVGNVIVILLFIITWFLRRPSPENPGQAALACSFMGVALALVTG
jgi:hypothetical protein